MTEIVICWWMPFVVSFDVHRLDWASWEMCSFQWFSSNPLGHNSSCSLCRANGFLGDCSFSLWKSFHVLTSHVQGCECCVYWFPFFCVTNILELFIWGSSINPIHFVNVQLLVFVALFIDTNQINQSHHLSWFQSMHQPNLPVQYKYLNQIVWSTITVSPMCVLFTFKIQFSEGWINPQCIAQTLSSVLCESVVCWIR